MLELYKIKNKRVIKIDLYFNIQCILTVKKRSYRSRLSRESLGPDVTIHSTVHSLLHILHIGKPASDWRINQIPFLARTAHAPLYFCALCYKLWQYHFKIFLMGVIYLRRPVMDGQGNFRIQKKGMLQQDRVITSSDRIECVGIRLFSTLY